MERANRAVSASFCNCVVSIERPARRQLAYRPSSTDGDFARGGFVQRRSGRRDGPDIGGIDGAAEAAASAAAADGKNETFADRAGRTGQIGRQ